MPVSTCPDCGEQVIWARHGDSRIRLNLADAAPDQRGVLLLIRMSGSLYAMPFTTAVDRLIAIEHMSREQARKSLTDDHVGHLPHRCP